MKKHIVCFGDSNTHGYCAESWDCADGGSHFNEEERWTCLLQQLLGPDYLILEEGLDGVYDGPFGGTMRKGCAEKSQALAPFYEAVARRRGCAFLDAEGVAEFNRTDCMHLTRSGHAALARKLAELVPQLVNEYEKQSV